MSSVETISSPVDLILEATADLRRDLLQHPIYSAIRSQQDLQTFMQHHVFAVYDFMWLLKRLQREICSVDVPWLPPAVPELARFINEIVLAEESDDDGRGGYCSHFQLYLEAMGDVAASSIVVEEFVAELRRQTPVDSALRQTTIPDTVCDFVNFTYQLAAKGSVAEVAAAFCFGREDIIPEMFQRLLNGFSGNGISVPRLQYYIRRHIELDGDQHGPLTRQLVNQVCGQSQQAVQEAINAARKAISHRITLWDGVLSALSD